VGIFFDDKRMKKIKGSKIYQKRLDFQGVSELNMQGVCKSKSKNSNLLYYSFFFTLVTNFFKVIAIAVFCNKDRVFM
jgi:hypothetical protein